MQSATRLGMSLGQMLAGAFDDTSRRKGELDGATMLYRKAMANKAQTDADLNQRSLDLDPYELAANQLGVEPSLGAQLKKYAQTGDYGNGSMDVPNNLPDGTRNLANSSTTQFIKPTNWDDATAQRYQRHLGLLKFAIAQGDKNTNNLADAFNKADDGSVRYDLTKDLPNANPMKTAEIIQKMSAFEKNISPIEGLKFALGQKIANGEDGKNIEALTTLFGKGLYNNSASGTFNMATGAENINDVGRSNIRQNNAQAANANASAAQNYAQADLYRAKTQNVKDGKGEDGSQATMKDMAQLRDDIRAEYNATYPIGMTGKRNGAPPYRDFEKNWLKTFNTPESDYYRGTNQTEKPKASAAYQEYLDAYNRAKGNPEIQKKITERARKNGVVK